MPDRALSPEGPARPVGGQLALPPLPGALRRFWRRHPWWVDSILAGAYFVVGVFGILSVYLATGVGRPVGELVVLLVGNAVGSAALLVRRRRPWVTFAVLWVTTVVAFVFDGALDSVGIGLALYALAVYRSIGSAWIGFVTSALAGSILAGITSMVASGGVPRVDSAATVGGLFVVITLIATLIGVSVGNRRRYVRALVDRAEQLARERDQQARLATAAERARITREMHDVVAHSLSIMVSLSDGADAIAEKDPVRSRAAISEIGEVGRRSLAEMRRLLGALDTERNAQDAPLHPQPGTEDLPDLVATFRTAGLPVAVESQGEPPAASGAQSAIYRIVQEALTNALRYADRADRVLVRLDYGDVGTVVTVIDDGSGGGMTGLSGGAGRGLIGMRERAHLYGGTMEAGPLPAGGWRVQVTLPQAGDDE